jgi:predicted nucleic acid-binding protein
MHVLLDINILLDAFCNREPFESEAKALLAKIAAGEVKGSLAATSLTNFHYVARKLVGAEQAASGVSDLMTLFDVIAVDRIVLHSALSRSWPDFEDAVQDAAAELCGIATIVTRDASGFSRSARRIVDAAALVAELETAL